MDSMQNEQRPVTVEIAGVTAKILCRFRENYEFLLPYQTEKAPAFTVEITPEDVAFSLAHLGRYFGERSAPYSDSFLENVSIQNVLSKKLLEYDVLALHGSALCMDGEAIIFTAKSGTGKSTHARLWRETFGERVWMINDDKPMIRLENGKAVVYGTPWDGKHHLSRNASAPLRAVVKLERDERNRIEPMNRADAFQLLMTHGAVTRRGPMKLSGAAKLRAMALETALLDAAAFYRLGCNVNPDAARIAWEGIRKNQGNPRENGFAIDHHEEKGGYRDGNV